MRAWVLIAVLGMLLSSCSSERQFGSYDKSTHTWATSEGTKVEDRVSGQLIDPKTAVTREYLGETYYFANEANALLFESNPKGYQYAQSTPAAD